MKRILTLAILLATGPLDAATFQSDDGVTLHYDVVGRGETVVLLSGGPGFNPVYMRPIAERLAKRYRCVIFHQRGTGRSSMETVNAETHALRKLVADLDALRRELKLEKLTIAAHSWGGILSMLYASEHPDRIRALALIDSGGPTLASVPKFTTNLEARLTEAEKEAVKTWSSPAKVAENRRRAVLELTKARTPAYFADRKAAERFIATLDEETLNDSVFWAIVLQLQFGFDLRPALKKLEAPVLVIHGAADPLESAAEVHQSITGSRLEIIEGAGHFPWLEKPEKVYGALVGFLAVAVWGVGAVR